MISIRIQLLILALIVLIASVVRLYGLSDIGVGGSDTILYFSLAEAWLRGETGFAVGDSVEIFRPVLLAFNALSLTLLGHTDYAIKLANTLLDGMNMALVAALAWSVSRRQLVVMASVATYAFLPIAVWSARQELPHTLSTTFVLLACLFTCQGIWATGQRRPVVLMSLGGLALLAAIMVHEELVFIAPPLVLAFVLGRRTVATPTPTRYVSATCAFCLFPLIASLLVMAYETERVSSIVQLSSSGLWAAASAYPERAARFLWNGVVGASSSIFAISCGLSFLYYCRVISRKRAEDLRYVIGCGLCLCVPLFLIGLTAIFFGTIFPRGVLPVMPLLLITVYFSLDRLLAERTSGIKAGVCGLLVLVYVVSSLASFTAFKVGNRRFGREWAAMDWPGPDTLQRGYGEFLIDARYLPSYATHWRKVHDALGERIDDKNRLLVVPSTVFYAAGRRALQTGVYLGDNAVYRLDHVDQPLPELIRSKSISYVLFTVGQNRGIPSRHRPYVYGGRWGEKRAVDLAAAYDMRKYSVQAEYRQVAGLMQAMGARPLSLFPPGSFESRVARVWQLP